MYSYEDRLRAVQLYIKLDKRIGLTIVSGQPHHLDERLFARFSLAAATDAAAVRRYGCSGALAAG